jgi:hypothetical protein
MRGCVIWPYYAVDEIPANAPDDCSLEEGDVPMSWRTVVEGIAA